MIIDFHTHTFPEKVSGNIIDHLSETARIKAYTDGSNRALQASMEKAGIDYSVTLPVITRPDQVDKINRTMTDTFYLMLEQGIIQFGGLHPDYVNYRQEIRRLKAAGIPGVKLHPAYLGMDLDDPRMMRLIDAISEEGLITLIHGGIDIGLADRNYASVPHILKLIREVGPEHFVAAHVGAWGCWDEVESDLAGAPIWFDVSFALGPIVPRPGTVPDHPMEYMLDEEAFLRLARKHGMDKMLFATDSPWEDQKEYLDRFRNMNLTAAEKDQLLGSSAMNLLQRSGLKI